MIYKPGPYYNNLQLAIKLSSVPSKMVIAGRGVGKTTIISDETLDRPIVNMPRGKSCLGGLTYLHIRTKSMPAIIDQWERRGIFRNIHYFVGHKAPKKWGWQEPFNPPLDYSNCIHFYNGHVIEFISFDRPEMARSGSYDYVILDEVQKLKKSAIDADLMPANRGNKDRFGHLRFHHGTLFLGTQPLTPDGDWVFEYEKLMQEYPKDYLFLEASALVNIKILGEKYYRDLERVLPKLIYDLEIKNLRRKRNGSKFYPLLSSSHGYYRSVNYSHLDSTTYDVEASKLDSRADADCYPNEPLYISLDFGSTQNCMVVAQKHHTFNEFPVIKNFYVEGEILGELIEMFIAYYKYHPEKVITMRGGSDGNKRNDAASRESYFDKVISMLTAAGWMVTNMAAAYEIPHMDKFLFWQKYLSAQYAHLPAFRINMDNAGETYVSMDQAPILPDEIKKDKRSERRTDQPRWKATDLSDAVDNLYFWELAPMMDDETIYHETKMG